MSRYSLIQDAATQGESLIASSGDDRFLLFTLVSVVCVGLVLVGRHLLDRQIRIEARSRRRR